MGLINGNDTGAGSAKELVSNGNESDLIAGNTDGLTAGAMELVGNLNDVKKLNRALRGRR